MNKHILFCGFFLLLVLSFFCFGMCVGNSQSVQEKREVVKYVYVTVTDVADEKENEPEKVSLGMFKASAYCPCEKCCGKWANGITATGTTAKANHTIAVDPDVIPYGTTVLINGKEYVAEDCGGGINGNEIDIYMDSHKSALKHGVKTVEVFTLNEP